jgi:hypothetical protein
MWYELGWLGCGLLSWTCSGLAPEPKSWWGWLSGGVVGTEVQESTVLLRWGGAALATSATFSCSFFVVSTRSFVIQHMQVPAQPGQRTSVQYIASNMPRMTKDVRMGGWIVDPVAKGTKQIVLAGIGSPSKPKAGNGQN